MYNYTIASIVRFVYLQDLRVLHVVKVNPLSNWRTRLMEDFFMNLNNGAATGAAIGMVPISKVERLSKDKTIAWKQCIERLYRLKVSVDAANDKANETGEKAEKSYARSVGHGITVILGEMEGIARTMPMSLDRADRKFFVELGFDATKDTGDRHNPPTHMKAFPAIWGLVVQPKNDVHLLHLPLTYSGHLNTDGNGFRKPIY